MERMMPITFKCRLTVKTPFSITTGEELSLLEYVIRDEKLYFIDFRKFIEKLKSNGKFKEFFNLMKTFSIFDLLKLWDFYYQNVDENVSHFVSEVDREVKSDFERKFKKLKEYLRSDRRKFISELGKKPVKRIFRNPVDSLPYVPGSSVKGPIRTSILNYLIKEKVIDPAKVYKDLEKTLKEFGLEKWPASYSNEKLRELDFKKLSNKLGNLFSEVEKVLMCSPLKEYNSIFQEKVPQSARDLMRFVKVSDFRPATDVKTAVGIVRRTKRNGETSIYNYVEYVKDGVFEGEVVLYPSYLKKFLRCSYEPEMETLVKALRREFNRVFRWESEFLKRTPFGFPRELQEKYKQEPERIALLKLGFSAGALSKTFSADDRIRVIGNRVTGLRNMPTELPLINGKPVGWCLFEVVD
jgi:CRISPR-associated protein Csm5